MMRCPTCGQRFVSPRSVGFDQLYEGDGYFDGMNTIGRLGRWQHRMWFRGRHRRLAAAGASAGQRLLEIGASWGEFVGDAQRRGFDVLASEYSSVAALELQRRVGVPVQVGPFDASYFVDRQLAPVDVVCMWDVIEHVPQPAAFVAELATVTRPGTVIGFSCPNVAAPLARLMGRRWHTFKPDEHLWHFDAITIRRLWTEGGFDVVWLTSSPLRQANGLRFDCLTGVAVRNGRMQPTVAQGNGHGNDGESANSVEPKVVPGDDDAENGEGRMEQAE